MIVLEEFDPAKAYVEIKKFSCGHAGIDSFITQGNLKKQVANSQAAASVLLDTANGDKLVGYYTLVMSELARDDLNALFQGSMPARIGCARLVMLGVHSAYQKSGDKLGLRLLRHALVVTKRSAQGLGCRGMYLDADAGAVGFYQKLGFTALQAPAAPGAPTPMFLPIESFF